MKSPTKSMLVGLSVLFLLVVQSASAQSIADAARRERERRAAAGASSASVLTGKETVSGVSAATASGGPVDGKWEGKVTSPQGDERMVLDLKSDQGKVTGFLTDPAGVIHNFDTGKLDGKKLTLSINMGFQLGDRPAIMEFDGTVDGESIKFLNSTRVNGQGGVDFEVRRVK